MSLADEIEKAKLASVWGVDIAKDILKKQAMVPIVDEARRKLGLGPMAPLVFCFACGDTVYYECDGAAYCANCNHPRGASYMTKRGVLRNRQPVLLHN